MIIVIGAAGFIGGQLVRKLRASQKQEVVSYDNFLCATNNPGGIWTKDAGTVVVPDAATTVFYMACRNQSISFNNPEADAQSNYGQLAAFLGNNAVWLKRQQSKLVYASSVSVYGFPNGTISLMKSYKPDTPYGVSKMASEKLIPLFTKNASILQYSNVYGPGQRPTNPNCGVVGRFVYNALRGDILNVIGPDVVRTYTYVGDVVDATIAAARQGRSTQIIAGRDSCSNLSLAAMVSELCTTHVRIKIINDPSGCSRRVDSWPTAPEPTSLTAGLEQTILEARIDLLMENAGEFK